MPQVSGTTNTRTLAAVLALLPAVAMAVPTSTTSTSSSSSSSSSTSTITSTPAYCTTAPARPAFNFPVGTTRPVPPLPCTGAYDAERGLCCKSSTDPDCSGAGVEWQLPLAPCVTSNPLYRGCPGNMLNNVCCESARVSLVDGTVSCDGGKSLFTIMMSGNSTSTSSYGVRAAGSSQTTTASSTSSTSSTSLSSSSSSSSTSTSSSSTTTTTTSSSTSSGATGTVAAAAATTSKKAAAPASVAVSTAAVLGALGAFVALL